MADVDAPGCVCVACLVGVPLPPKRRRLYGPSSATALEQLQALTTELGNVLPPRQPGDDSTSSSAGSGPFLCLPCFKQLEKRAKLVGTRTHVIAASNHRYPLRCLLRC